MYFCTLFFTLINFVAAKPLVELKDSFGDTVVPYHHNIGRKNLFQQINASINKKGYGPRTFLRQDVHKILTKTFKSLEGKPLKLVYGEGSWGGKHGNKPLKPHRSHNNGLHLDIFMPLKNNAGKPVYFPIKRDNLFGYAVNFNKKGITIVVPHMEGDFYTENYDFNEAHKAGCQFVCMNYQYVDANIDRYITKFKERCIMPKPRKLR